MKINGQRIDKPSEVLIPIIRGDQTIMFKAGAVLDFEEFDQVCPAPKPPTIQRKGESQPTPDFLDAKYIKAIDEYARRRSNFLILKSLSVTPGIEWESVKLDDPTTYDKFESELTNAGLNQFEIVRIVNATMEANGLDDSKIEEAKKHFLASQQAGV